MEPLSLATHAVPVLVAVAGGVVKESAKAAAETVGRGLVKLVRRSARVARDLDDLKAEPEDELNADSLRTSLAKALREDPDLAAEVERLLADAGLTEAGGMRIEQKGDGNKAAQASGSDIDIEIH